MKTIFKRILRSQGGFTLIELLAVLAIISVLAGIVTAAVSGTKGASALSQVKSDGSATATSTDNYNTASITGAFPDTSLESSTDLAGVFKAGGGIGVGAVLLDSQGVTVGSLASVAESVSGNLVPARRVINFTATTESYGDDGKIREATFVPDFLASRPSSLILEGDETHNLDDNTIPEFLWLYAVTSPGSDRESRKVEVYQLTNAVCRSASSTFLSNSVSGNTIVNDKGFVVSAKTALNTALAARDAARKDLAAKKELLAKATIAHTKAVETDSGVVSAAAALRAAQVALGGDATTGLTLSAAELTIVSATTALGNAELIYSSAFSLVKTKIDNLTASQLRETASVSASDDDKCIGTNIVTNLKYTRVF